MSASLLSIRLDWLLQLTRECQAFLGQLASTPPHNLHVPRLAEQFLSRIADPSNAAERLVFRSFLLQIAIHLTTIAANAGSGRQPIERMVGLFREWGDRSREMKTLLLEAARTLGPDARDMSLAGRARREIDANYASPMTIRQLGRTLGCHPKRLARAFQHEYGESIPAYLATVRMRYGVNAIKNTDLKVEAIARMVGYRSKKNFYRAVRQATGMTPRQLRLAAGVALEGSALEN